MAPPQPQKGWGWFSVGTENSLSRSLSGLLFSFCTSLFPLFFLLFFYPSPSFSFSFPF